MVRTEERPRVLAHPHVPVWQICLLSVATVAEGHPVDEPIDISRHQAPEVGQAVYRIVEDAPSRAVIGIDRSSQQQLMTVRAIVVDFRLRRGSDRFDTAAYDAYAERYPDISLKEDGMRQRLHTYKAYSLGCVIVWAAILLTVAARRDHTALQKLGLVCAGWWIGWLSATIARSVYPPPRRSS